MFNYWGDLGPCFGHILAICYIFASVSLKLFKLSLKILLGQSDHVMLVSIATKICWLTLLLLHNFTVETRAQL